MRLTVDDYLKIGAKNSEKYIEWLNTCLTQFNINTPNRLIAFFMNVLQESGDFVYVKEVASGSAYEGNKSLGNTQKGDGVKFKGRGLGQITGRWNYTEFTRWCKTKMQNFTEDFSKNPELLEQPKWAVLSAFWYWEFKKCEKYADEGNFRAVASLWNTGRPDSKIINGWDERLTRKIKIEKWITALILG